MDVVSGNQDASNATSYHDQTIPTRVMEYFRKVNYVPHFISLVVNLHPLFQGRNQGGKIIGLFDAI